MLLAAFCYVFGHLETWRARSTPGTLDMFSYTFFQWTQNDTGSTSRTGSSAPRHETLVNPPQALSRSLGRCRGCPRLFGSVVTQGLHLCQIASMIYLASPSVLQVVSCGRRLDLIAPLHSSRFPLVAITIFKRPHVTIDHTRLWFRCSVFLAVASQTTEVCFVHPFTFQYCYKRQRATFRNISRRGHRFPQMVEFSYTMLLPFYF